ncbi:hypothetical protein [Enterovibrio baiacu]|uniref:hypothetical protein n=1 Tax=Enterovibrio baiacu TaxID=2491023 RepID=UPI003D0FABCE
MLFIVINGVSGTFSLDFGGFADRGLDSSRFQLFEYGVKNMFDYPFGGMQVVSSEYDGEYFHNMFLDIVRVAGYIIMLIWLMILSYFTHNIFINTFKNNSKTFMLTFLMMIVLFNQDLAFDGSYNMICLMFFIMGLSLKVQDNASSPIHNNNTVL